MRLILLASVALLAACEENTDPAPAPAEPPPAVERTVKVNPAIPLALVDCAVDRLPVTGACPNADPRQFLTVDDSRILFTPGCIWTTHEVQTAVEEAVIFRTQDCTGAGMAQPVFAWEDTDYGGQVVTGPTLDEATQPILDVFRLTSGLSLMSVALDTLATAPPEQRDQCILAPLQTTTPGPAFVLVPNDQLQQQLEVQHPGELYDACGVYGVTDAAQMWEQRRTRALFHLMGQDESEWDVASFTFYKRGGDGWIRDE